jgi:hypothetical protein
MQKLTFPCSVNSVPFYPEDQSKRSLDAAPKFAATSYINSLLKWQTKLPYLQKRLFADTITLQFKTQENETFMGFYLNPAILTVHKCKVGIDGNLTIGDEVVAFTTPINVYPEFWGRQKATYDIYTDPITLLQYNLVTYMWSFRFGDHLAPFFDSGIYFIKFTNFDTNGDELIHISEPILVFGSVAEKTMQNTLLIETKNLINKNDIIIDGWTTGSLGRRSPVFRTRVEADILEYQPKGIYLGFMNQNWLQYNSLSSSWETWVLNIGSITSGVPVTLFRIVTKLLEMDIISINNEYYSVDLGDSENASATELWKMKKPRIKGLISGSIPIRYKYLNSSYSPSLTVDEEIFTEEFGDAFE